MNYGRKYEKEEFFVFDFDKLMSVSVCVHHISLARIAFSIQI